MEEFSQSTQFKLDTLESQMVEDEINIESFLDTINSVFEERENVLKSADLTVIQNFKKIMMIGGKKESTVAATVSRLSNGKRPFTREYAIMFCYAAGYNAEQADNCLKKIFLVDGFHLRNYEDLIDFFYLRENTLENCIDNFSAANEMKANFIEMYTEAEVDASVESSAADNIGEYTEFFEEQSKTINCAEQLDDFLRSGESLQKAGTINRTAKAYFYDVLIELCTKIIDRIDIVQSNDELERLYSEIDGKKLSESIIKLVQDIFDPYSYYELRKIDTCTRPQYYERYIRADNYKTMTQNELQQKHAYTNACQRAESMVNIWNSNYNNIAISFDQAIKKGRFSNLIHFITEKNGSSSDVVLKQLRSVYFHSMFNLMVYDSEWGLTAHVGLPHNRTQCNMAVNENAVDGDSPLRGFNQINEMFFFYSPELSEFVINYMNSSEGNGFSNIYTNDGVHIKPFTVDINSVNDLLFIAVSMLNSDTDDEIDDYIDRIIYETGEMPADDSAFSQKISALVKELDNTKSTAANTMLINGAPTVNRSLLAFCLVLRELLDESSKDPNTLLDNVNQSLIHCKMAQLNPHNPLDLLLLGSIFTKSPLSYIKAYMLYMVPNI